MNDNDKTTQIEQREEKDSATGAMRLQHLLVRQPLSIFGKLVVMALIGAAVFSGILALIVGFPSNTALLFVGAGLLVAAGLAATGFRWMSAVMIVVNGIFLYQVSTQPYVTYHLSNPKAGGFPTFVLDLLIVACVFVAFIAAIVATIQTYRPNAPQTQQMRRWLPSALVGIAGVVLGAILIAAIAAPGTAAASTTTIYTNGVPTVHMSAANFSQPTVTIGKGAKLLLIDDVSIVHILSNGSWQNGRSAHASEPGAPVVNHVMVNGSSVEIGPFTTTGTFHIYCLVHPGMNLTIIVQ